MFPSICIPSRTSFLAFLAVIMAYIQSYSVSSFRRIRKRKRVSGNIQPIKVGIKSTILFFHKFGQLVVHQNGSLSTDKGIPKIYCSYKSHFFDSSLDTVC